MIEDLIVVFPESKAKTCNKCQHRRRANKKDKVAFCNLIGKAMHDGRLSECIRMAAYIERRDETHDPLLDLTRG